MLTASRARPPRRRLALEATGLPLERPGQRPSPTQDPGRPGRRLEQHAGLPRAHGARRQVGREARGGGHAPAQPGGPQRVADLRAIARRPLVRASWMMMCHHRGYVREPPSCRRQVKGQQRLLPPNATPAGKPPTDRNAERRTTVPHATNPSTDGPGRSGARGKGLSRIAAQVGSSRRLGPTRMRAASSPSRGLASKVSAARPSAPGAHHESSSLKAMRGRPAPGRRRSAPRRRCRVAGRPW